MLALFCSRGWEIPIDSGGAAKWLLSGTAAETKAVRPESGPELGISKEGDCYLRRLLGAH